MLLFNLCNFAIFNHSIKYAKFLNSISNKLYSVIYLRGFNKYGYTDFSILVFIYSRIYTFVLTELYIYLCFLTR